MKKVRFGIIGIGNQGNYYASLLKAGRITNGELVAICDNKAEKLELAKQNYAGLEYYDDYKKMLESKKYDAIIAMGVVIQGATPHAGYINNEVAKSLAQLGMESGTPVTYGMITADNIEQAIERSGTKAGNKGADAAHAAIEMANLNRVLCK